MKNGLTQKQENFTLNIFQGLSQREAYIKAGYSPNSLPATLDRHAHDLTKNDKVKARLAELNKKAESAKIADVKERKEILSEITRTVPSEVMEIDALERNTRIKPEALNSHAVSYLRTEQTGPPGMPVHITRIGLVDKVKAIDLLNKMDKIYSDGAILNVDNRKIEIHVNSEKAKELTERLIEGERTFGDNGHKNL